MTKARRTAGQNLLATNSLAEMRRGHFKLTHGGYGRLAVPVARDAICAKSSSPTFAQLLGGARLDSDTSTIVPENLYAPIQLLGRC